MPLLSKCLLLDAASNKLGWGIEVLKRRDGYIILILSSTQEITLKTNAVILFVKQV